MIYHKTLFNFPYTHKVNKILISVSKKSTRLSCMNTKLCLIMCTHVIIFKMKLWGWRFHSFSMTGGNEDVGGLQWRLTGLSKSLSGELFSISRWRLASSCDLRLLMVCSLLSTCNSIVCLEDISRSRSFLRRWFSFCKLLNCKMVKEACTKTK